MHIRVLITVIGDSFNEQTLSEATSWASPGTKIDIVNLARGPASIESEYDEAWAGPGILERVAEGAQDGVDAMFIDCFADPAVHAAREIADFPVVGGYEPAVLTALTLGERVGIITVLPNCVPMLRGLGTRYAIGNRVGPIRVVDMPVLELHDRGALLQSLYQQASSMATGGEADVVVLGCTGMMGVAAELQARLQADGSRIPVIDPTGAAIGWLETCVRMGLRPSRTTYMPPLAKERTI